MSLLGKFLSSAERLIRFILERQIKFRPQQQPSSDITLSNIDTPFSVSEPNTADSQSTPVTDNPVMSPLTDLSYLDNLTSAQQAEYDQMWEDFVNEYYS